ncbi:MAG TPA: ADP-polyphosphate phosphotransferase [Gemmatimonadales bacterium]|jgi:PPK2 family polyphosphate:nucleotide phosphotransferase|nr:ADP-polyphosphate phosphotransferase [Gemmatimonadales bacterium]
MPDDIDRYRVRPGHKVHLDRWHTAVSALYDSPADYDRLRGEYLGELRGRQQLLYADDRYALLVIFQAMDAAGKDSVIKHVMSGVNPQGCQVTSFKHPSAEELDHDFLWRTTRALPERGRIGIFNRSYYEEVLIARVHPEILRAEQLPDSIAKARDIWRKRFESITAFERHLHRNGTQVVKFFLHLSPEEQRRRFLARIDDANHTWKFNVDDMAERMHWDAYMKAYAECLTATSTQHAPWYIVPADDKKNTRLIVSRVILKTLAGLRMRYPRPTAAEERKLKAIARKLRRP